MEFTLVDWEEYDVLLQVRIYTDCALFIFFPTKKHINQNIFDLANLVK